MGVALDVGDRGEVRGCGQASDEFFDLGVVFEARLSVEEDAVGSDTRELEWVVSKS